MLISFVKFLKLMKETFENNVEINFEVHTNFENLDKKKKNIFLCVALHMCGHHYKYKFSTFNLFFQCCGLDKEIMTAIYLCSFLVASLFLVIWQLSRDKCHTEKVVKQLVSSTFIQGFCFLSRLE